MVLEKSEREVIPGLVLCTLADLLGVVTGTGVVWFDARLGELWTFDFCEVTLILLQQNEIFFENNSE